ncbi:hypothetical protein P7C73_g671, partial [Tremellales sp. Uapishka_1]
MPSDPVEGRRSPQRKLSHSSHRKPSKVQDIFVGIAFHIEPSTKETHDGRDLEYSAVLHDGTGVVESETFTMKIYTDGKDEAGLVEEAHKVSIKVLGLIGKIQREKHVNVRMIAIAQPVPPEIKGKTQFFSNVWLHVDAIPFTTTPATSIFTKLPAPSTQASATSAISAGILHLHPATHSGTTADVAADDHHVQVDCDGQVVLCGIKQYQESTSPELWKRFTGLTERLKENKVSIAFFSATPQGGGVALMRHALLRLWKLVGIEAKWFVPEGHPTVFDITKRKIHNVLQGVAPKNYELDAEDKKWFELWTEQNYESFWSEGAIDASIIVIDDPQLTALIPLIKKKRPDAKIIFRSHIQVQSELTDDPSTPQHRTWNYLFNFIKDVDLFLAHPVRKFVPENVHESLPVLYMAPSTDPLDGLNKPYGAVSVQYYRQQYNSLSTQQCGITIDWDRGYVCQIARFDPSKGIDVLLAAYLEFRQKLDDVKGPYLIIMGHGSVDDPDGTTLATKEYELVKNDVSIVRAPPSDSILGCILQGSWVATQLSTREGFEVKVTEAINHRVPIIASDAGGIPLQVKEGVNGWVVPSGNSSAVASLLLDIHAGKTKVTRQLKEMGVNGSSDPNGVAEQFVKSFDDAVPRVREPQDDGATSEDFWTVGNATRWMWLFSELLGIGSKDLDMGAGPDGGGNVWKMVMGGDMPEGDGDLI